MRTDAAANGSTTSVEAKIATARRRELIARITLIFVVVSSVYAASRGEASSPAVLLLIAVMVLVWRRLKASLRNIRTITCDDSESKESETAPVVYLRPFSQDREIIFPLPMSYSPQAFKLMAKLLLHPIRVVGSYYTFHATFELLLRRASRKIGPLKAIGAPDAKVASSAVVTHWAGSGDDWRAAVRSYLDRASLVVLRAGTSDGLLWELQTAVDRLDPAKLLIYVGDRQTNLHPLIRLTGWYKVKRHRAEFYREFRDKSAPLLPRPLPDTVGRHRFVRFEPDWTPVVVSWRTRSQENTDAERVANYMASVLP